MTEHQQGQVEAFGVAIKTVKDAAEVEARQYVRTVLETVAETLYEQQQVVIRGVGPVQTPLERYGVHTVGCTITPCTCGLGEAINAEKRPRTR